MINMIQLQLKPAPLVNFLSAQGVLHRLDSDNGYAAHAWLCAAFGNQAIKAFRIYSNRNAATLKLLAYTEKTEDELKTAYREFAEPLTQAVLDPETGFAFKTVNSQDFEQKNFGFEVLSCPVTRQSRSGVEKDAFLRHLDHNKESTKDREAVYAEWLADRLEGAATIDTVKMDKFSLVTQLRRPGKPGQKRQTKGLRRPQARLQGQLKVVDSTAFEEKLLKGIGRHKSFGYGMLLLKPAH